MTRIEKCEKINSFAHLHLLDFFSDVRWISSLITWAHSGTVVLLLLALKPDRQLCRVAAQASVARAVLRTGLKV